MATEAMEVVKLVDLVTATVVRVASVAGTIEPDRQFNAEIAAARGYRARA